jgi:tetratricopeptide (TPR) repeat protein
MAFRVAAFAQAKSSPMSTPVPPPSANAAAYVNAPTGEYLSGQVTVKGATLPWEPLSVTVTCDGKTRYTTTADAKGNFMIGSGTPPVKGAEPFAKQFIGCEVAAVLPGFDSSRLTVAERSVRNDPKIGTITLNREEGSGGSAVSSTTAAAPKDAAKAFEKARSEWLDQKPDRAERDLQKAVQIYPQFAEAWYQLGRIQESQNASDAQSSFAKAVAIDPKFVLPYGHLTVLAERGQKWQELADVTSQELQLNPQGTPQVWYYNALGNFRLNKVDVAQASAEKALAMDPLHTVPVTEQLLAVILVGKQDYAGALQHLRNCLTYFKPGPNLDLVKQQISQLEAAPNPQQPKP